MVTTFYHLIILANVTVTHTFSKADVLNKNLVPAALTV
jgi:hypothetical protein